MLKPLTDSGLAKLAKKSSGDFSFIYRERIECSRDNPADDIYPATWSHATARECSGCGLLFLEEYGNA